MKHLNIKSDGYFYQIMNGKVEMFEVDVQELKRLINNYKDLLRWQIQKEQIICKNSDELFT